MPNFPLYLRDEELDAPDRRAFTQYVAGLPDLEAEQNQQRFRAAMADIPPPSAAEPAPLSDLDRFRQRVGGWGDALGQGLGQQIGRIGEGLGERTAGIRSALPGGEAWNADLERIRGEREASEQQFPTPVSAAAQTAPVPPGDTGPSAGLRPTRPLELPQSEAGTPEGERITGALAETATRGTPGGGLFAPGGLVGESLRHLAGQEPSVLLRRADRPRDWQEAFGRMGDPNDPRTQAYEDLAFGATEAPRAAGALLPRVAPRAVAEGRPAPPVAAGNITLSKFPAEVRDLLARTAEEAGDFLGQRRGTITDVQAARQGVQEGLGTTVEQWLRSKPGRAFNQEEALALGNTLTRVGREYDALQTEVLAAREGGTLTSEMQAQLADKALEFGTLAGVRAGSAAEAGRALRSFRTALTGAGASGPARERAIGRAFEAIGADPERFATWLDEFTKIAPENVQGRYHMLQALYQPKLMDNLTTWRYASMLSGWKTHLANTSSNFLEAGARPLVTLHTGLLGEPAAGRAAPADVGGMLNAIPEALAAAGQTFRTGVSRDVAGKAELSAIRPQALTSPLGRAVRAPIDLLSAADEFWKVINFNGALRSEATLLARRTGRTVNDVMADGALLPGLHDRATQAARVATFTEDPGQFVNDLLKLRGRQGKGGAAVQFLLPFVRTPANIFRRTAQLAASPVTETIGAGRALQRGDTEAARLAGARALIGAEALLGIGVLVHNGFITGAGPDDATRRRELEATGWQPNSARIGNTYVSLANMGPIGQEAIWVANLYEAAMKGKPDATIEERIDDGARRIGQVLVNTSYVSGIGDFFQSIQQGNLRGGLVGLAGGVAGSLVPYGSALATAERLGDPTMRSRETPQDIVAGRLPGVSQLVPPEPGLYGEPRRSFEATAPGVLLPWRTSQAQQDPMANEVARLVQAGQSVPVPSIAPREAYAGQRQTREQRAAVNQELGTAARRYLERLVISPDYQRLNDEQKAATLRRTLDASRQLADLVVGDRVARDPQAKADLEWARTPQYEGVRGTPDEVALQNLQVREAKNLLSEYRQRYGQDMGEIRLLREDRAAWLLSQREALDTDLQALRRGRIRERFGVSALDAERAPLLGAGNRPLLPPPGAAASATARAGAFTAP